MTLGITELIILILALSGYLALIVLAVRKLFRSKISAGGKIGWLLVMIFFQFAGMVIFLFYHDMFLSPVLRANF